MKLIVHSNPVPAPRMTQRDKWKKRPVVLAYWEWRDRIKEAWINLPTEFNLGIKKRFSKPVIIGFKFHIIGYPASDLDNYIKGVKDALVRAGIIKGDTIKHVPKYDNPEVFFLCDDCLFKMEKECPGIRNCKGGFAVITIKEIE